MKVLDTKTMVKFELKTAEMIHYNSKAHRDILFSVFKKNRKTVAFWLTNCVFLHDLKQFTSSISASAWDLADVRKRIGFSGTKDNRWLLPDLLSY
jgi:hypothetical protein